MRDNLGPMDEDAEAYAAQIAIANHLADCLKSIAFGLFLAALGGIPLIIQVAS